MIIANPQPGRNTLCDLLPCERTDCQLTFGPTSSTLVHWEPVYDRQGRQLGDSQDPNSTFGSAKCSVCKKSFSYKTQYGATSWTINEPKV